MAKSKTKALITVRALNKLDTSGQATALFQLFAVFNGLLPADQVGKMGEWNSVLDNVWNDVKYRNGIDPSVGFSRSSMTRELATDFEDFSAAVRDGRLTIYKDGSMKGEYLNEVQSEADSSDEGDDGNDETGGEGESTGTGTESETKGEDPDKKPIEESGDSGESSGASSGDAINLRGTPDKDRAETGTESKAGSAARQPATAKPKTGKTPKPKTGKTSKQASRSRRSKTSETETMGIQRK